MKKIILLTILAVSMYAGGLPGEATKPLDTAISWLGELLIPVITIAILFLGYTYFSGKQEKAKEYAINIFIGGVLVGAASSIAVLFK